MRHKAGRCTGTSTSQSIFIMTPSLEGWPTKAKEAPSPNEVRLTPLDTNPVFQCLGINAINCLKHFCIDLYVRFVNIQCIQMQVHIGRKNNF